MVVPSSLQMARAVPLMTLGRGRRSRSGGRSLPRRDAARRTRWLLTAATRRCGRARRRRPLPGRHRARFATRPGWSSEKPPQAGLDGFPAIGHDVAHAGPLAAVAELALLG